MWWNDSVFEGTEEHRRCSGKVTDIRLAGVEKLFPWWRDSSLRCASFRMTGLCFLLTIRNLIIGGIFFETQRFFFLELLFMWAKLAKFIRYEAMWWRMKDEGCGVKSMSREGVSCELWVMNYEVWVRGEVVKLKYFASWKDSSLRYASFRMTGLCFLLAIRNLYYWGDFFESQRFFFLNCFFKWAKWEFASELRKLCFKYFIIFK